MPKNSEKGVKKKLGFVWKRIKKSLEKRKPSNYEEKKAALEKLKEREKAGELKIYYADGSAMSMVPSCPYAWQKRGERLEIPCFKGKTLNLFGLWDAKKDLQLYASENALNSEMVIAYMDNFLKDKEPPMAIVIDNAPIHTSNMFIKKQLEWKIAGFEVFNLPTYSPKLNLIEHLWRFMKYEWIEFSAYDCWNNLVNYVEKIAINFGTEYTINFV